MKNLVLIYVEPYGGIHIISFFILLLLLSFRPGMFVLSFLRSKRKVPTSNLLESKIVKPKDIISLQELSIGTRLVVLDNKTKLPIVQRIDDYGIGVKTKIFENTFYLDKYGTGKLEKLRTYSVESIGTGKIRVLEEVFVILNFYENSNLNLN